MPRSIMMTKTKLKAEVIYHRIPSLTLGTFKIYFKYIFYFIAFEFDQNCPCPSVSSVYCKE